VRDALQASEQLRQRSFVDKNRVALIGFSWGAAVALLASSSHYVEAMKAGPPFAAIASFYPPCFRVSRRNGRPPFDLINSDVGSPLLVLMGEKDTESPPSECIGRLEAAKKAGASIDWHLYPQATHCWDCEQLDGLRKIDVRGHRVEYRFRRDVTLESESRLFKFLEQILRGN
jgi:dienelactone hydrolase